MINAKKLSVFDFNVGDKLYYPHVFHANPDDPYNMFIAEYDVIGVIDINVIAEGTGEYPEEYMNMVEANSPDRMVYVKYLGLIEGKENQIELLDYLKSLHVANDIIKNSGAQKTLDNARKLGKYRVQQTEKSRKKFAKEASKFKQAKRIE